MNHLAPIAASHVPALVAAGSDRAAYRFLEFFTANIRNPHTRRAYARAAGEFFDWLAVIDCRENDRVSRGGRFYPALGCTPSGSRLIR